MKSRKKLIIVKSFLFILLILGGSGIILLVMNQKSASLYSNNHYLPPKPEKPSSSTKIKKTTDNLYSYKSEWEHEKGGGSSEATFSEKNFSAIITEHYEKEGWKKEILINWKSELKDNLWLVKERQVQTSPEQEKYLTYYENDQGKKLNK